MSRYCTLIDLFACTGGLSEWFERAGCAPVAHIEMDNAACDTRRTRSVSHYLDSHCQIGLCGK